jgi:hypothetical protein
VPAEGRKGGRGERGAPGVSGRARGGGEEDLFVIFFNFIFFENLKI